jgi:hypothetical protein
MVLAAALLSVGSSTERDHEPHAESLSGGAGSIQMIKTVEAVIDEGGNVRLLEPPLAGGVRRALVTILEERPTDRPGKTARLSESALAQDWERPEEDEAWKTLAGAVAFPLVSPA